MGRSCEWMSYRQFVLEIVTEENHDKYKRGWKCVIKSITNVAKKCIVLNHRMKTTKCIRRDEDALYWSRIYFSTKFVMENITE